LVRRLNELAEGGAQVAMIDVDEEPRVADAWGVVALPTVTLWDGCKEKRRWVGAVSPSELAAGESSSGLNTGMRRRR
jgi:thioredoxin-like negative regulator of GroEL